MSEEQTKVRRFQLGLVDKILLGVTLALMFFSIVLSLLQRRGLSPVDGALLLYLPVLAVLALLVWGVVALRRVIKRPMLRNVITGVLVVILLFIFARAMTYIGYLSAISVPRRYNTVASPSGAHSLIILRTLDSDESHFEARRAARLEADPDSDADYAREDLLYTYTAYPPALFGLFYHSDADVEGEVRLALAGGSSTMMVEWLKDETVAHFYVDNPGVAEGGEMFVRF